MDQLLLGLVQGRPSPALDVPMRLFAVLFSGGACVLWSALAALALLSRRRAREGAVLFFGTAVGSSLSPILKRLVGRPRPPPGGFIGDYSFPSGHALSGMIFFGLLAWMAGRRHPEGRFVYGIIAAAAIFLEGYNRLYLGVHWPSDVFGGWLIGGLFLAAWIKGTSRFVPA